MTTPFPYLDSRLRGNDMPPFVITFLAMTPVDWKLILFIPAAADEVFIEHQPLTIGQQDIVIEARDRLFTPPLVVDAPFILDGRNALPPL
jgi:hypothetical protein